MGNVNGSTRFQVSCVRLFYIYFPASLSLSLSLTGCDLLRSLEFCGSLPKGHSSSYAPRQQNTPNKPARGLDFITRLLTSVVVV